jgi:hypothetical protein
VVTPSADLSEDLGTDTENVALQQGCVILWSTLRPWIPAPPCNVLLDPTEFPGIENLSEDQGFVFASHNEKLRLFIKSLSFSL